MAEAGDDAESGTVKNPMGLPEDEGSESLLAKEFTPEQVEALQAYLSAAKPKPAALQQRNPSAPDEPESDKTETQEKLDARGAETQPQAASQWSGRLLWPRM